MGVSCALFPTPGVSRMSSAVLKWIANGMIGLVVAGTLWIAQAVQPSEHDVMSLFVNQAVASADEPASAPTATR